MISSLPLPSFNLPHQPPGAFNNPGVFSSTSVLWKLRGNDRFERPSEGGRVDPGILLLLVTCSVCISFFPDCSPVFLSVLFQWFCRRSLVRFPCLGRAVGASMPVSPRHVQSFPRPPTLRPLPSSSVPSRAAGSSIWLCLGVQRTGAISADQRG